MELVDPGLVAARHQPRVEVLHGTAQAGTPREAAQQADAVLLVVHWSRTDDVLKPRNPLITTELASNLPPLKGK